MIDIITSENRHLFEKELHEMFQMRYKIAVDKWGWNIPDIKQGYDKDQFDTDATAYFLAYGKNGQVIGCARLNSTEKPHLLSEIFSEQCEFNGVPTAKNIHEFSRFIIDGSEFTGLEQLQLGLKISLAITEYCLENAIEKFTILVRKDTYAKTSVLWKTRPLGAPKYYEDDDASYIAGVCDVNEDAIKRLREFSRIEGPVAQFRTVKDDQNEAA